MFFVLLILNGHIYFWLILWKLESSYYCYFGHQTHPVIYYSLFVSLFYCVKIKFCNIKKYIYILSLLLLLLLLLLKLNAMRCTLNFDKQKLPVLTFKLALVLRLLFGMVLKVQCLPGGNSYWSLKQTEVTKKTYSRYWEIHDDLMARKRSFIRR